jgi:hypothetical protein
MRKQQNKRSGSNRGPRRDLISHPPPIQPQLKHRQKFRYVVTGTPAVGTDIGFGGLLDAMIVATTAVTAYQLFDAVKVEQVEVWALPAVGGTAQVSVQFSGSAAGLTGDGAVHSDNSMGIEPAHVRCRPQKMSQAAQWQNSAHGGLAFEITAPVGAVIDVDLSFRTIASQAPVASAAIVAGTTGEVYYRGMDGLAIAATQFVPQAPTTA